MLVISLTSIPPRFGLLPPVLDALLAQGADAVALTLPRRPARFAPAPVPALPAGVTLIETEDDLGPAGKLLAAAARFPGADILYCDDDWLYAPGWAATFRAARAWTPRAVIAGSTWSTERLHRTGGSVAEGYAGVLVPADVAAGIAPPPPEAWAVDDLWLSGQYAALGREVIHVPAARALISPLASPDALQDTTDRAGANAEAAALVHQLFGIWPKR
jgi:hypothetical protein